MVRESVSIHHNALAMGCRSGFSAAEHYIGSMAVGRIVAMVVDRTVAVVVAHIVAMVAARIGVMAVVTIDSKKMATMTEVHNQTLVDESDVMEEVRMLVGA